ncbi:FtsW/RodA/SpoVE family cell cycle protein [Schaalia vaccimaxillae]|uniref:FtsW/RodA/SpoVE family cell cycle protein n=1 Tax=Schaalia vaccimaxillae TaxID=183916 RepID=UPI0003B42967|nr:FtsW/RodA/SpoVE family cell cycle protein [Schaalia vaccimaxillae]
MTALREWLNRLNRQLPVVKIPRIRFGSEAGRPRQTSPVATYYLVIIPALVLMIFGLVMGFSAQAVTNIADGENPYVAYLRPLGIILAAMVLAAGVQVLPPSLIKKATIPLFAFALVFQSLVATPLGIAEGGNANWVKLPGLPIVQPSELLKLALVLMLAQTLSYQGARLTDLKQMGVRAGAPLALGVGAIMLGHDMGTAMVAAVAALGTMWVAGLPGKWFAGIGAVAFPTLIVVAMTNPTRMRRIAAVLPWNGRERNLSAPEQIDHSLWALGSGGLTGLGPGASREKWDYLQAAHTDFILAIIGEEFGLLGTLAVVVCLGLLIWGMVRVCQEAQNAYASITAGGIATWIGIQACINIMSVTEIGPVIGVPLPLVSYGGSSFIFTALAVGVVGAFARDRAGMWMIGRPDESSAGRDPRVLPKRRKAR